MNCCANCFGNKGIKRVFSTLKAKAHGRCGYCESDDVDLMEPARLKEYFESLTEIYEPDTGGRLLVEWLKEDWGMFSHPEMDTSRSKDLLGEILDDGEMARHKFSPSPLCNTDTLVRWEKFREELMHKNRFFPDVQIDLERLKALLARLVSVKGELPLTWYRARLQEGDIPFTPGNMGVPPNTKASHGRANPPGIPYLYLGSLHRTAIAELRPHTSEKATVAEFAILDDLKIIDLREPRKQILPYVYEDVAEIALLRGDIGFLERLGEELTRPVLPQGAAIDYLPSQYLCEYVKKCGYDGILYKSSVSDGVNLALFYPDKAIPISITVYLVTEVTVDVEAI